jgi:hypothetical protein
LNQERPNTYQASASASGGRAEAGACGPAGVPLARARNRVRHDHRNAARRARRPRRLQGGPRGRQLASAPLSRPASRGRLPAPRSRCPGAPRDGDRRALTERGHAQPVQPRHAPRCCAMQRRRWTPSSRRSDPAWKPAARLSTWLSVSIRQGPARNEKPRNPSGPRGFQKLRGEDLNLRPSGYEPDELPDCSTPLQNGVD